MMSNGIPIYRNLFAQRHGLADAKLIKEQT